MRRNHIVFCLGWELNMISHNFHPLHLPLGHTFGCDFCVSFILFGWLIRVFSSPLWHVGAPTITSTPTRLSCRVEYADSLHPALWKIWRVTKHSSSMLIFAPRYLSLAWSLSGWGVVQHSFVFIQQKLDWKTPYANEEVGSVCALNCTIKLFPM